MLNIIGTCFMLWLFSYGTTNASNDKYKVPKYCMKVNVSICNNVLPYNYTKLPNYRGHTQSAVKSYLESDDVTKLIRTNCSADLVVFLCILHLPICLKDYPDPVPPCRKLCEKVQRECLPTIRSYGREWPIDIECHKFSYYEKGVCMKDVIVHNNVVKNDTNKLISLRNRKGSCKCKTDEQKLWSLNRFMNRAFDFVLIAKVSRIMDAQRIVTLNHVHVYREGKVKINRRSKSINVHLSCPCPYLKKDHFFVIMGREDQLKRRLVLNRKSFVYQTKRMKNMRKLKKLKHVEKDDQIRCENCKKKLKITSSIYKKSRGAERLRHKCSLTCGSLTKMGCLW